MWMWLSRCPTEFFWHTAPSVGAKSHQGGSGISTEKLTSPDQVRLLILVHFTRHSLRPITMVSYSEDQLAEFQEAFQLFDSRGDNKIHVSQIGDALRALGQNPTESDVKKFTHQHKPDERISFEVFLPIYQAISKARTTDTAEDFIEGLRHFDKDGNGSISSAELRHLLTTLGEKLTDEEVEQLLAGQEDSQGNVNYEEFVHMVMCG